jgi:hypothetical protein
MPDCVRSGVDSNSRFRLFSAKTANFLYFPFSAGENPIAVSGSKRDRAIAAWRSCLATGSTAYGLFDLSRRPPACGSLPWTAVTERGRTPRNFADRLLQNADDPGQRARLRVRQAEAPATGFISARTARSLSSCLAAAPRSASSGTSIDLRRSPRQSPVPGTSTVSFV